MPPSTHRASRSGCTTWSPPRAEGRTSRAAGRPHRRGRRAGPGPGPRPADRRRSRPRRRPHRARRPFRANARPPARARRSGRVGRERGSRGRAPAAAPGARRRAAPPRRPRTAPGPRRSPTAASTLRPRGGWRRRCCARAAAEATGSPPPSPRSSSFRSWPRRWPSRAATSTPADRRRSDRGRSAAFRGSSSRRRRRRCGRGVRPRARLRRRLRAAGEGASHLRVTRPRTRQLAAPRGVVDRDQRPWSASRARTICASSSVASRQMTTRSRPMSVKTKGSLERTVFGTERAGGLAEQIPSSSGHRAGNADQRTGSADHGIRCPVDAPAATAALRVVVADGRDEAGLGDLLAACAPVSGRVQRGPRRLASGDHDRNCSGGTLGAPSAHDESIAAHGEGSSAKPAAEPNAVHARAGSDAEAADPLARGEDSDDRDPKDGRLRQPEDQHRPTLPATRSHHCPGGANRASQSRRPHTVSARAGNWQPRT